MPTKLKKPITVTFYHVENIIETLIATASDAPTQDARHKQIREGRKANEVGDILRAALQEQGICPRTWTPPQPLKAGKYDAEILPGGAIKVECQMITREQILELKRASDEASKAVEPEWPKYFEYLGGGALMIRADSPGCIYEIINKSVVNRISWVSFVQLLDDVERGRRKQFTATEAARILGKEVA